MLRCSPRQRLNLSNNEMRHPRILELQAAALSAIAPSAANTYPDLMRYRARFAELLGVPQTELLMAAGSDNAYLVVLGALACRGGTVLTQDPNYSQLFRYADIFGLRVRSIPMDRATGQFDLDEFRSAAMELEAGDILAVSNPNGPVGSWWSDPELLGLAEIAGQRGAVALIDEAYARFGPGGVFDAAELPAGCVVVESMSKSYGMAGARLAFVRCAEQDHYRRLRAWNLTNPVSQLAMDLAVDLLGHAGEIEEIRQDLCAARKRLATTAQRFDRFAPPSQGNFQVVSMDSPSAVARCVGQFAGADIAVRDLARFGLLGSLRITACADPDLTVVLAVAEKAFADG